MTGNTQWTIKVASTWQKYSTRQHMLTPGKLLAEIYTNPKARFQLTSAVYRASGHGQRSFLVPEIGIRATQGHSRDDVGPEVLCAAQELLNYDSIDLLPVYCVHGTSIKAWEDMLKGTRSLMARGPGGVRRAVYFAVSLPGDTETCIWL